MGQRWIIGGPWSLYMCCYANNIPFGQKMNTKLYKNFCMVIFMPKVFDFAKL
jgi:hypothetical protein